MERGSPGRRTTAEADRHIGLVVLLAAASGGLDAVAVLGLGGVFASVMTGNLVLLGLGAGTRHGGLAGHAGVALVAYAVGVAVGVRMAGSTGRPDPAGWSVRPQRIVVLELVLVSAFAVGWELTTGRPSTGAQLALMVPAALAMGLQGAAMRSSLGSGVSTTYLTGTLTGVVSALAGGRPLREEGSAALVLVAAVVGAALSGLMLTASPRLGPVVPLVALACAVGAGRAATLGNPAAPGRRRPRSGPWVHEPEG